MPGFFRVTKKNRDFFVGFFWGMLKGRDFLA